MPKPSSGRGSVKIGAAAGAIKSKLKGIKIIDWHEVGTPHPELITATVQTGVNNFKTSVAALVAAVFAPAAVPETIALAGAPSFLTTST